MNDVTHTASIGSVESRLKEDTCLECRICWNIYDPAMGDDIGQVPAGTAFSDLPQDWCCPECESPREMYLPIGEA